MKNQKMKTIQHHTRSADTDINEDVYVNVEELKTGTVLSDSVKKNETPTTKKVSTNKSSKSRIILAALILLIIMFLILVASTGLLLKYYLEMNEEVSQLKNHDLDMNKEVSQLKNRENAILKNGLNDLKNRTDEQQRIVLEGVKTFKKDLDIVKEHFLQDIKAINKTIETICGTCPSGWEPVGLFCYYFSTDHLTWDNARDECIRKRSGLVMLKTREETEALKSILEKARYWIGSRRDTKNANWKWLDGSVMSFSIWRKGEPNNSNGKEDCVESWNGNWNDRSCTDTEKYVCKKGCCC
ncbi:C-type lectin domain family 4 member G-like isoform X2 [Eleutherodactylus coqui]|uniref:C-type lectin domain family 4 member G-like isoform X2 n=1 Tax=Eleutherodactylus coqui TaxID=57060 RepID=UPI0034629FCE